MTPMKMKSGIAISVSLAMMPKMRDGSAFNSGIGKRPNMSAISATASETPPSVSAAG